MKNFTFYNPVKVIFGEGQIQAISKEISPSQKILFLYGHGSIKKNGIYDQIKTALKGYPITEFPGIGANPQYDKLMQAVELARENKIDFILAVGGGSVIDSAKFISMAIHEEKDPWEVLSQRKSFRETTPYGCVLTLPATGSEMNAFSVISRGKEKLGFGGDPRLYPQFSILDPTTSYSLPEKQLANGIVDAFVHVLEQYLTKKENALIQDAYAESILKTLIHITPKVIHEKDLESRSNFMWSATQALNGLIGVGVTQDWSTHMIGHELTGLYGIDHARSLAAILPSLLRVQKENKKAKLLQYANHVWNLNESSDDKTIEKAITATEEFFHSIKVPTNLSAYDLNEKHIPEVIASLQSHFSFNLGEDQDIDSIKLETILHKAL